MLIIGNLKHVGSVTIPSDDIPTNYILKYIFTIKRNILIVKDIF